jgi:protease-4
MGQLAGSGGYWVSMYGSRIVASPYTLTGSIGVIGTWFYDNGLGSLLGFSSDSIQNGEHADLLTGFLLPHRDLSEAEEEQYRNHILDLYGEFVEKVAAGRGLSKEAVEEAAQGRIYSGEAARSLGLVDQSGSLWDAVQAARELAGIAAGRELVFDEYPKTEFIEALWAAIRKNLLPSMLPWSVSLPFSGALEELHYRLSQNGRVMPIMPLEFTGVYGGEE